MNQETAGSILLIYTGGTIGSLPVDPADPLSPLAPAHLDQIMDELSTYDAQRHTILIGNVRIRLDTYAWEEPIDSSNVRLEDWVRLARVIKENYGQYDGFVVLHGTDTLAYSASAIAFMLDSLAKPVIFTGSQRPIGAMRTDAFQNLITSIEIAAAGPLGREPAPEVCIFFRDELLRACRATKRSATSYHAFESPNFPALGTAGERVVIRSELVRRELGRGPLAIAEKLEPNIASLRVFPGMSAELMNNMLRTNGLRGVVLQTFGTGNAPTTTEFLSAIDEATSGGKLIVDVTQCFSGEVELGRYEVSAGLLTHGVVSGMDMTPEAALTKMSVILGRESRPEIASDLMQINLKGEQRCSVFHLHFDGATLPPDDSVTLTPVRPMTLGGKRFEQRQVRQAMLRVMGLRVLDGTGIEIDLKTFLDQPGADAGTPEDYNPHFLGRRKKALPADVGSRSLFLDITDAALRYIDNEREHSVTIVNAGGGTVSWDRLDIALYADC